MPRADSTGNVCLKQQETPLPLRSVEQARNMWPHSLVIAQPPKKPCLVLNATDSLVSNRNFYVPENFAPRTRDLHGKLRVTSRRAETKAVSRLRNPRNFPRKHVDIRNLFGG